MLMASHLTLYKAVVCNIGLDFHSSARTLSPLIRFREVLSEHGVSCPSWPTSCLIRKCIFILNGASPYLCSLRFSPQLARAVCKRHQSGSAAATSRSSSLRKPLTCQLHTQMIKQSRRRTWCAPTPPDQPRLLLVARDAPLRPHAMKQQHPCAHSMKQQQTRPHAAH